MNHVSEYIANIVDFQECFELVIKLYLFKNTIYSQYASIGQDTLGLTTRDSRTLRNLSRSRLILLAMLSLVMPFAYKRLRNKLLNDNQSKSVEVLHSCLSLINFVLFLRQGRHKTLSERVVKATTGYSSIDAAFNQVNYDYMNKELLWFAIAEFLSFSLPLLNIQKLKNMVNNVANKFLYEQVKKSDDVADKSDETTKCCAICDETPCNVHEIGCAHVFCYFCAKSVFDADTSNGLTCPQCGYNVTDEEMISSVKFRAN